MSSVIDLLFVSPSHFNRPQSCTVKDNALSVTTYDHLPVALVSTMDEVANRASANERKYSYKEAGWTGLRLDAEALNSALLNISLNNSKQIE